MSLFSFFFTTLASLLFIQMLTPLALNIGLVDRPKGRKNHSGEVPLVGGLSIFCALVVSSVFLNVAFPNMTLFIISMSLVVILGVLDDFFDLSVVIRLCVQFFVAFLFVFVGDYQISYLGIFFGYSLHLGNLSIPFTLLAVVAAINMFNMIDGIDGLLGMMALKTFGLIGLLFYLHGHNEIAVVPVIMCCALLPFLVLNIFGNHKRKRKKIFMGDGGSMFMGFAVVWLLVIATQPKYGSDIISPAVALWLIAIPLMDMVAIMIRRITKGQSPFMADREHLHHIFLRLGLSPKGALVSISLVGILLSGTGIATHYLGFNDAMLVSFFIAAFLLYYTTLRHIWRLLTFIRKISR